MPRAGVSVAPAERPYDDTREIAAARAERPPRGATPAPVSGGVPGRRTITIQGRGAERYTPSRRRPQRRRHERAGFRPDRAALWAVLLGVLLVLGAATSSHAAVLRAAARAAHTQPAPLVASATPSR